MGRGPPGPDGRPVPLGIGRRAPGGGGIGRPVELSGRPGGGGIGRPVELSGGRVDGAPPSPPSPEAERCVGRIVVGPSGETVRVGAGLATGARLRTTLGAGGSGTSTGALGAPGALGAASGATVATGAAVTRLTRIGAGASEGSDGAGAAEAVFAAVVVLADLAALAGSSGWTTRRSPSASARRRMRSAWASSMEAEGLDAPIPSFWASASNSLLVRPSSLESSCTRIFFWAKTFPCFTCSHYSEHSCLFFHNYCFVDLPPARRLRKPPTSLSDTAFRSARTTWLACRACSHSEPRHHQIPRPVPRPTYHEPSALRPARTIWVSSRLERQTTHVRTGAMRCPPRSLR
jgi:hypothetical protein